MKRIIGLGWDVGGWLGKNHGIAAVEWDNGQIKWLSLPTSTRLPKSGTLTILDFFSDFDSTSNSTRVIAGIDAPLGYSVLYRQLVSGECTSFEKSEAEINNPLAYRETERHIYRTFRKKPLSATFDKLGNNTSVAIMVVRNWCREYNFHLQPSSTSVGNRNIIEVYPAL